MAKTRTLRLRLALASITTQYTASAGFVIHPAANFKHSLTRALSTSRSFSQWSEYERQTCVSHNNVRRRRHSVTLLARPDGDEDERDGSEIFYDDFSDVAGGSFASSSMESTSTLPDFDDEPSSPSDADGTFTSTSTSTSTSNPLSIPPLALATSSDLTGCTLRQFSLGSDLVLSDYVGSLGFDRVTDWQYYLRSVDERGNYDEDQERTPVKAPFMDPSKPARTRSSSGSVARLFRGEFCGRIGAVLRANGMDNRILLKEYSVDSAHLAEAERKGVAKVMSNWFINTLTLQTSDAELLEEFKSGRWMQSAQRRYVDGITDTPTKADDAHLLTLLTLLNKHKAPFTALLGEMNLNDYYDDPNLDPNQWYKSLGVKPPSPGSTWLVYDYHGLSTASSYAVPLSVQRSKLPPKRGVFGNLVPPPSLPPFKERARYLVAILRQMLCAVAEAHDAGVVHKSIGRNSFLISSVGQDKREATSPYAVAAERLRVLLSDWGFSQPAEEAARDAEFVGRARSFGVDAERDGELAVEFAMAEDLHALGFVFLALLFTTLAEPAALSAPMPPTDDDTWQRLFSEIFEKDTMEFREYCADEEVWSSVVELLDGEEGAGWDLLGGLLLAREGVVELSRNGKREGQKLLPSARSLLSSPFFRMRII